MAMKSLIGMEEGTSSTWYLAAAHERSPSARTGPLLTEDVVGARFSITSKNLTRRGSNQHTEHIHLSISHAPHCSYSRHNPHAAVCLPALVVL